MATIITKYEMANTSDKWLVVGDYSQIISSYETVEDAAVAYEAIGQDGPDGLAGTRWASVKMVAPGQTLSGQLAQIIADVPQDCGPILDVMFGRGNW